jgi:orotate phosphoribosyltransferase
MIVHGDREPSTGAGRPRPGGATSGPGSPPHPALVAHLLRHAVRRGDFVLKSGRPSTWFIDAKQTTCRPDGMLLVADALLTVLPDDVTAIGGLTMGADAAAFATAAIAATRGRDLRAFSVRKEEKDHGGGGRVAGALEPGDRVAITEDAVTRGVSMLEAADVVRAYGAEPVLLVPVVDRGGSCATLAAAADIAFHPLVTAPDLGFPYDGSDT